MGEEHPNIMSFPTSLSLLYSSYRKNRQRHRHIEIMSELSERILEMKNTLL